MNIIIENLNTDLTLNGESPFDVFKKYGASLPKSTVAAVLDGNLVDWHKKITSGQKLEFVSFDDPRGKYIYWHTSAHILAQAILRHFPNAKPTIGPPIDQGFYYDFADLTFSENDFKTIELEMQKIINANLPISCHYYKDMAEAEAQFKDNSYKAEIIAEYQTDLTAYSMGEFTDLCRGPHLLSTGKVGVIKLLRTSGAYWKQQVNSPSLTRIYGISFPSKKELFDYTTMQEEALKRDHRTLGQKLELFSIEPEAPGMPFLHPKGMSIYYELLKFWKELHNEYQYQEIRTPGIMRRKLWETSGHWNNYLDNMYSLSIDDEDYAIKPMNCPGCCVYMNTKQISYKQLPIRIAEIGSVYRHELSGVLSGLFRVRSFNQDDSHLFMMPEQVEDEIVLIIELASKIYSQFGLKWRVELSTRPEKSIGSDADWEQATDWLRQALIKCNLDFAVREGDGAFYGPKIDFHLEDALKRNWQCGTIQVDLNLPNLFKVNYIAADGSKKQPVMLHRAIFGSVERFFGILIEHYAGRFPLWLSPIQVRVIAISADQEELAKTTHKTLLEQGFKADIDLTSETLNKKIRLAQVEQVNYSIILGAKEAENGVISVRTRNGKNLDPQSLADFMKILANEASKRLEQSPLEPAVAN